MSEETIKEQYRVAAGDMHHVDGETEIDPGATVSLGDDDGAYVQAWVWVPDSAIHGDPADDEEALKAQYRSAAGTLHHRDGETEIDPGAPVSLGDDDGAYVQAWEWVPDSET